MCVCVIKKNELHRQCIPVPPSFCFAHLFEERIGHVGYTVNIVLLSVVTIE